MRNRQSVLDAIKYVIESDLELRGVELHEYTRFKRDYWFNDFDLLELYVNLDLRLHIDLPDQVADQLIDQDCEVSKIVDVLMYAIDAYASPPPDWKVKAAKDLADLRWSRRSEKGKKLKKKQP